MRSQRVLLSAAGCKLVPLNDRITGGVSITALFGDHAISATAQVDGVNYDKSLAPVAVSISRSGTTVTVTFPTSNPHLLGASTDYIAIGNSGNAGLDGVWEVASITSTTVLTFTSSVSGTLTNILTTATPLKLITSNQATGAVSATVAGRTALATTPYQALVLNCTTYSAGTIVLDVLQPGHDAS